MLSLRHPNLPCIYSQKTSFNLQSLPSLNLQYSKFSKKPTPSQHMYPMGTYFLFKLRRFNSSRDFFFYVEIFIASREFFSFKSRFFFQVEMFLFKSRFFHVEIFISYRDFYFKSRFLSHVENFFMSTKILDLR